MRRYLGRWTLPFIYFNVASNLLLFAVNPAWGSMLLAWVWMVAGFVYVISKRRRLPRRFTAMPTLQQINNAPIPYLRSEANRHMPVRTGQLRRSFILDAGERVIPIPQMGGVRTSQVPARGTCSHWPRDEVKLNDGTTVAYICRRCGKDWADEQWVMTP